MLAVAVVGCGGSSSSSRTVDPQTLLRQAKQAVDATSAVHFTLSLDGIPDNASGTVISGGSGDIKRPDLFKGTFQVSLHGLPVPVAVVSAGGKFYIKDPLHSGYQAANPQDYGVGDPAVLLDPQMGVSALLLRAPNAKLADSDRLGSDQLNEVQATFSGQDVHLLISSVDAAAQFTVHIGVTADDRHELRRLVLEGPVYGKGTNSKVTIVLDKYGEDVQITPPPTG